MTTIIFLRYRSRDCISDLSRLYSWDISLESLISVSLCLPVSRDILFTAPDEVKSRISIRVSIKRLSWECCWYNGFTLKVSFIVFCYDCPGVFPCCTTSIWVFFVLECCYYFESTHLKGFALILRYPRQVYISFIVVVHWYDGTHAAAVVRSTDADC